MPLMPGISTSAMTQEVSRNRGDTRNSRADANVCAEKPSELNNRAVAVRTEASSSTIEIIGTASTRLTFVQERPRSHPDGWCRLAHDTTELSDENYTQVSKGT